MVINMRLSDLQNKDVVDVETGEKIGNVIDVLIDKHSRLRQQMGL